MKLALASKKADIIASKQLQASNSVSSVDPSLDSHWLHNINAVKLINQKYFKKSFKAKHITDMNNIDTTVQDFTLNTEQERAFCIIANHSVNDIKLPLKMYIGGMAGTGKSQVIKALIHFFEKQSKSFIFLILAPTGSAAALVSGSIYHLVLGFRSGNTDTKGSRVNTGLATLGAIKEKLKHVDYVFLNEVSMLDCLDMYSISSQMSLALQVSFDAFGGKNMIFDGDFAQLPPIAIKGPPLYTNKVSTTISTTNSIRDQKMTMEKSL